MSTRRALRRRVDTLAATADVQRALLACELTRVRLALTTSPWSLLLGAAAIGLALYRRPRAAALPRVLSWLADWLTAQR